MTGLSIDEIMVGYVDMLPAYSASGFGVGDIVADKLGEVLTTPEVMNPRELGFGRRSYIRYMETSSLI